MVAAQKPEPTTARSARARRQPSRPAIPEPRSPWKKRQARTFTRLHFTCGTTGLLVEYEVRSDPRVIRELWPQALSLSCPHCDEVHRFAFRTAFIRGAIAAPSSEALRKKLPS
jgi:hypothetical protein